MGKIIYNKLVRDRIPEIIKKDKAEPKTRILEPEEYLVELIKKLIEEADELRQAKGNKPEVMKEVGDILEIIDAIIKLYGLSNDEVIKLKEQRRRERGGFEDRIFLESVEK